MLKSFLKKLWQLVLEPEPSTPTLNPSSSDANQSTPSVQQSPTKHEEVTFNDEGVRCIRRNGLVESVRWDDLQAVIIETTDQGPFVDDLFWILVGSSRQSGCVVPSQATGCQELLTRLQQLPGFDNKAVILASQSVGNDTFLCWRLENAEKKDDNQASNDRV